MGSEMCIRDSLIGGLGVQRCEDGRPLCLHRLDLLIQCCRPGFFRCQSCGGLGDQPLRILQGRPDIFASVDDGPWGFCPRRLVGGPSAPPVAPPVAPPAAPPAWVPFGGVLFMVTAFVVPHVCVGRLVQRTPGCPWLPSRRPFVVFPKLGRVRLTSPWCLVGTVSGSVGALGFLAGCVDLCCGVPGSLCWSPVGLLGVPRTAI